MAGNSGDFDAPRLTRTNHTHSTTTADLATRRAWPFSLRSDLVVFRHALARTESNKHRDLSHLHGLVTNKRDLAGLIVCDGLPHSSFAGMGPLDKELGLFD